MFSFHLVQSGNAEFLLMKTQGALKRSSECANVCRRKNQVFLGLFEKWSTLDPKKFYTIPSEKLVFLIALLYLYF